MLFLARNFELLGVKGDWAEREVLAEIGIELGDVKPVHVMHRKTNRVSVDVFFECWDWKGKIENKECEKCAGLQFFSLDSLPVNMIEYNVLALRAILGGRFYSEFGWE